MRLLIIALCLFIAPLMAQAPVKIEAKAKAKAKAKPTVMGTLVEREGTKILSVWGTAEERGFAEGYLMSDVIVESFEEFVFSPNVVPNPALWDALVVPAVEAAFHFSDRDIAWLKGLLRGIEARKGGTCRIRTIKRELRVADLKVCSCIPDLAGFLCSSFAAWGPLTKGSSMIVGRNLDYFGTPKMTENSLIKVNAREGNRAAHMTIGWAGISGCLTGMNEHGVWLAIHDVHQKSEKSETKSTPRPHALQELLVSLKPGKTIVEDAQRKLSERRFAYGGNAMFAWSQGEFRGARVLEFDGRYSKNKGVDVRGPKKGETHVACSNHHRLRSDQGHGCWRFARLEKGSAKTKAGSLTLESAWGLIKQSSVAATIYRCTADLDGRTVSLERRLQPKTDRWSKRLNVDVKALIRDVEKRATKK